MIFTKTVLGVLGRDERASVNRVGAADTALSYVGRHRGVVALTIFPVPREIAQKRSKSVSPWQPSMYRISACAEDTTPATADHKLPGRELLERVRSAKRRSES